MDSYLTEAAALLAALWVPYLWKILAADIVIGLVILSGYLWLRRAERRISALTEFKWTDKKHNSL